MKPPSKTWMIFLKVTSFLARIVKTQGLIDTWCRKKIAYILSEDRIGQLTATSVKIKAEELNVSIDIIKDENNEDKISFPEDKKTLKRLLRFLDEDIYKSSLSNTIFVASGKRKD